MVHLYKEILFSHKKEKSVLMGWIIGSVLMRWMNLEPIKQSEVYQKEKEKYSILMHVYGI